MRRRSIVVKIDVDKYLCKGCYICVDKCPTKVFEVSSVIGDYGIFLPEARHVDRCVDCGICELYCPDYAITIIRSGGNEA